MDNTTWCKFQEPLYKSRYENWRGWDHHEHAYVIHSRLSIVIPLPRLVRTWALASWQLFKEISSTAWYPRRFVKRLFVRYSVIDRLVQEIRYIWSPSPTERAIALAKILQCQNSILHLELFYEPLLASKEIHMVKKWSKELNSGKLIGGT